MSTSQTKLIRDPDDWARDWGWVSRRRALNLADRILHVSYSIEGAGAIDDEGFAMWVKELRDIAKKLAPVEVPAEKKRRRSETT